MDGGGRRLLRTAAVLAAVALAVLAAVLAQLVADALAQAGRAWATAGFAALVKGALAATVTMVAGALLFSLPLGLGAAVLRVEYLHRRWFRDGLDGLTATLTGLPAVVVGLVGFEVLVAGLGWPFSLLAGTVALAALNLAWVTSIARDALLAVPDDLREGALALGATRFQTFLRVVFPSALADVVGGLGVAVGRLMGEAALLVYTGGVLVPEHWRWSPWLPGGSLAVELWLTRTEGTQPAAPAMAAVLGLVLLALVLFTLGLAGWWASRLRRRLGTG